MDKFEFSIEAVERLLAAMKEAKGPAVIDWVNRTIRVLGPSFPVELRSGRWTQRQMILYEA